MGQQPVSDAYLVGEPAERATAAVYEGSIVKAQAAAQLSVYPDGLVEVPMSLDSATPGKRVPATPLAA